MSISDIGPDPNAFDLESATVGNEHYRQVAWTGKFLQLTLMSIPVGESIGLEAHPETDQFLRVDAGRGRAVMGPAEHELTFQQDVEDGWAVMVPAGTWHDVVNTGDEPLRLYVLYSPVHHAPARIQPTAQDAEREEETGIDVPPDWSFQLPETPADEHA